MWRQIPNALTVLRLLLAVPLGYCIANGSYGQALLLGFTAGASDALDGFLARRLDAKTRLGSILDPIADKTIITVAFCSFAFAGLIPWYLALVVVLRDMVIVAGAYTYHHLIGPYELDATLLSKLNMCVQVTFCLLILLAQMYVQIPAVFLLMGTVAVLFFAAASGFDYVMSWSIKALRAGRDEGGS